MAIQRRAPGKSPDSQHAESQAARTRRDTKSQHASKTLLTADGHDATARTGSSAFMKRLLRIQELPYWYQHNPYIHGSYRPVFGSVLDCLRSLCHLHNESVNIYSHLVPAIVTLVGNYALAKYFSTYYPLASWADQLVFHLYLTTSTVCFGVSAAYHTLQCHSEFYHSLWIRLDYFSIILQILGSFISGLYISFYCEPVLQKTYWSMIGSLGFLTCFIVLDPRLQETKWRLLRMFSFIATGLSAFAPIVHAITLFPYEQLEKQSGLRYYYAEGVLILLGCVFFGTNFPESWKPGKFDIWGSSHQWFHILVVLGALTHLCGILTAFEWNYHNPRC
ncbi:mPR-like GPCR protein [Paramyrothecium foliicola]|nr:mPR-like GPCR protein [Paramyrothecium foliicola]